ncbi:Ig-like domain-containing protein [Gorillibacterium sp. sgz5001074]|uniref:Ig-like domain-containing protein n=1 Tax=Gorillibacterium sp. sgz5001074 TaxID=3446695 RepID=UPI003F66BD4C
MRNALWIKKIVCAFLCMAIVLGGFAPLSVWKAPSASAAGDVLADTFDNTALGAKPAGWSIAPPAGVSVAVAEADGHPGRVLSYVQSAKTASSYSIKRTFTNTSAKAVLTYQVRAEQNNQVIYLPNLQSGTVSMVQLALYNGKFAYKKKGSSSWTELDAYSAGAWYDVRVALDSDAQVYDLYINNVQKLSQEPYLAQAGPVTAFSFGFFKDNVGAAYFDEFHVSSYKAVEGIAFANPEYEMAAGTTQNIPLVFTPTNATNQNASWSSSNPAVMTVNDKGVVTAVSPGTATLTATSAEGAKTASTTVRVFEVPITGIALDPVASPLPEGSRLLLQAHVSPDHTTDPAVTWSTDNPAVATVDRYGEVTAVAPGPVKVTAANKDGTIKGETTVTVTTRSVQHRLYVSLSGSDTNPGTEQAPFRTMAKAQEAVRALNAGMTGDIEVFLRGGTYTLQGPLEFTQADSGMNGYFVTYKSYPGEEAVLSGGKKITGWTLYDAAKGIYKADVGTSLATRQLFVDGIRAVRASSTGGLTNPDKTASGYVSDDTALAGYAHPEELELVYNDLWTNSRVGVQSASVAGGRLQLTLDQPAWDAVKSRGLTSATVPVTYENAYELLDQQGEWYLDRSAGVLYYKPRAWENMSTAEVIAPVLERLMNINGASADQPVRNLQFEGLHFTHTTWMFPSTEWGLSDAQNNHLRYPGSPDHLPDAAVMISYANTVNFERNDFSKLGITGIRMDAGTQNSLIRGNRFYDISGGAVNVGQPMTNDPENYNPSDHRRIMKNNDVVNNLIHDIGVDYKSAAAISGGFPEYMDISHNEIYSIPYSGTHLGYGWTKVFDNVLRNVKIENNLIYDLMGMGIRDGGAIYSLGMTGGSAGNKNLVRGNYIRNQMDDSAVLYTDEGSTDWRFEKNVIDLKGTPPWHGTMKWAQAWAATIHNNEFVNNYTTTERYVDNGYNNTWANNVTFPDASWPAEAQAIIAQSGIESGYADIGSTDVRRWKADALDLAVGGAGRVPLHAADGKDGTQSLAAGRIYYESADPSIATVAADGTVTGLATGSTKIKASIINNGILRTVEAPVTIGDTLAELSIVGTVGKNAAYREGTSATLQITGKTVFGSSVPVDHVTFLSSDPDVASVTPDGVLTAHHSGDAVLTLMSEKLGVPVESRYKIRVWAYGEVEDYTLRDEIRDMSNWYVYPSSQTLQGDASSITIPTPNSGHAIYQGRQFQNEMVEFDMTINGTTSWYAVMFGKQSPTAGYTADNNYVLVVSSGGIELHRFNYGPRTVIYGNLQGYTSLAGGAIPNTMLPFNQKKRVQLGTFEEAAGVRIIVKVEGQEIMNFLDTTDGKLRGPGYLGVIARTGSVTLSEPVPQKSMKLTGPASINGGEELVLTYGFQNVTGSVYAQSAIVNYNPGHLEYIGAESLVNHATVVGSTYGYGQMKLTEVGLGAAMTGSDDLVRLRFRALPVNQTVASSVYLSDAQVADGNGVVTPIGAGADYSITIRSFDKTTLIQKIAEAQSALDSAQIIDTLWGHYRQDPVTALRSAVSAAQASLSGIGSQAELNQAVDTLNQSLAVFRASVNTTRTLGDLAVMGRSYRATAASPGWDAVYVYDLNGDGVLDIADITAFAWEMN